MAHDATFKSAIPGQSLASHKLGALPHERPPKYTDPNEAAEYFWKQLNRPDMLKQIWYVLEKGATVWAITRAILYKAASMGIIQMNLGVVLYPLVGKMIVTIGKSKKINVKVYPKFRDKIADKMVEDHINSHFKGRTGSIPPSALTTMEIPKPEDMKNSGDYLSKLVPDKKQPEQAQPQPQQEQGQGLLSMAQGQ